MSCPREYQTEAVIIRKMRLGEADRIITLYTPFYGKLQAVAKAVCKPKSKLSGHLELLAYSQVTLARGKKLDTIIGSQTINSFLPLRKDLNITSCGLYLAELVNLFTAEADNIDNHHLFYLLVNTLERLSQGANSHSCLRYFEIQLLEQAGYRPQLKVCSSCHTPLKPVINTFCPATGGIICPRCSFKETVSYSISVNGLKVFRLFQDCDMSTALRLKLTGELNTELEGLIRNYCYYILEREIKSCVWLDNLK